jgi:thioredoxin-disulfide reductase
MLYDTIIIGAGPAGMTAAVYASRREMKTLVIGAITGGQVAWAGEIENYPGFKSIKSWELIKGMREQVEANGVEIKSEQVEKIEEINDGKGRYFKVKTGAGEYEGRTVVICAGLFPRKLGIPSENRYAGRGISYCANCDGPFYKGKSVAVVGGGNAALDAAEVMSKIAAKVYLVHRSCNFKAFEAVLEEVGKRENVEVLTDSEIEEISGETKIENIRVINNKTGDKREIAVDGVFIEIGRVPNTEFVGDFVSRDDRGQIIVDELCRTSRPGVFAGGDVTNVRFKQITVAIGQGTIAALAAYQYLQRKE